MTDNMTLNDYQIQAEATAVYPEVIALPYLILGLAGEAGELANKYKKVLRGDKAIGDVREALIDEAGDCIWYIAMIASELHISLEEVAARNVRKLAARLENNTIKGDGDVR